MPRQSFDPMLDLAVPYLAIVIVGMVVSCMMKVVGCQ